MLISKTGNAQISDYGLSIITSNVTFTAATTPNVAGPSRWHAPEAVDAASNSKPKPLTASKPADVFAFAMLAVEIFTGNVPFGDMKNKSAAVHIANGRRPDKPDAADQLGLTTEMWEFIGKCWTPNPKKRPTIDEVVGAWEGFVNGHVAFRSGSSVN